MQTGPWCVVWALGVHALEGHVGVCCRAPTQTQQTPAIDSTLLAPVAPKPVAVRQVSIGLWNEPTLAAASPAYEDIIYSAGYYSCYTLSVDLSRACDASRQAKYNPSPNDPTQTECVCPSGTGTLGGAACSPVDLSARATLFVSLKVSESGWAALQAACKRNCLMWLTLSRCPFLQQT
jgi:hypothetical protein